MKNIYQYIKESIFNESEDIVKISNLKVTYKINKQYLTVCVPDTYSESDMQIYLDDKLLDIMPGSSKYSIDILGENYKEISDAYFIYDSYSASDKSNETVDIEWDNEYDSSKINSGLAYYKLKDVKYCIEFSEFNLKNTDDLDIHENLTKIFKTFESNSSNKYPIEIKFESVDYAEI